MPALCSQIKSGSSGSSHFCGEKRQKTSKQAYKKKNQIKSHTVKTARMKLIEALGE